MEKRYKTMFAFVAEQNRLMRTGGLPADHPDGQLLPSDVPLSMAEKRFFEREERLYQEELNRLHGLNPKDTN